jgi:predicted permease
VASDHAADAAIGDALEELDDRQSRGHAPRWPGLWLRGRLVGAIAAAIGSAIPRALRSAAVCVRHAVHAIRSAPKYSAFVVLVLTAGITLATVTFSVVDAVILKPLPRDPNHRLVSIGGRTADADTGLSQAELQAVASVPGLQAVGSGGTEAGAAITIGTATEYVSVVRASADYLEVLRLRAWVGRLWTKTDEASGRTDVAIISHELAQRHFSGDAPALGQEVAIDSHKYLVVGVLGTGESSIDGSTEIAAWVPLADRFVDQRAHRPLGVVGRLRDGVSISQVTAQISSALAPLASQRPGDYEHWHPRVDRLLDTYTRYRRDWISLIAATVGLILLSACVNAAILCLSRSADRFHEFAVRASLGASRRWLACSLLLESIVLSLVAGTAAAAVSLWAVDAVKHLLPPLFRASSITVDARVFFAAAAIALGTGLLSGIVPAWHASRVPILSQLKDARTPGGATLQWRSALLITEVATVGLLLVVSVLFIDSFARLSAIDLGFNRENLITVSTLTDYQGTVQEVQARLAQVPGVSGAAAVRNSMPPLAGPAYGGAYDNTALHRVEDVASVDVDLYRVTPGYFGVTGMRFLRGATWAAADQAAQPVVIDEHAAQQLFAGADPIGQLITLDRVKGQIFSVVGVVAPALHRGPELDRPTAYFGMPPDYRPSWVGFVLRTSVPPDSVVHAVEASLAAIAPPPNPIMGQGVHVADAAFRRLTATRRFSAGLMSTVGVVSLLIAIAGVYAVMASIVAQRTRDIGIRIALGATAARISGDVIGLAGRHVLLGLLIGLPIGWWISRGFAALFFQITPSSPSVYAIVGAVVTAAGVLAAWLPARRAARIDPVVSLRAS